MWGSDIKRMWTEEEVATLRLVYLTAVATGRRPAHVIRQLAVQLNRTTVSVRSKLEYMHLTGTTARSANEHRLT